MGRLSGIAPPVGRERPERLVPGAGLSDEGLTNGGPLHVAITVDPEIPVPPQHYGGIERVVDMLVRGLSARGHDVRLFAHPASQGPARLVPYRGRRSSSWRDTFVNGRTVWRCVRRWAHVDVIHSFSRMAYLLPLLPSRIPKIQTYQRHVTARSVRLGMLFSRGSLSFTACSRACARTGAAAGGRWTVIPNGVPADNYRFTPEVARDAPLVFLGRLERIKGTHTAIEVARRTGRQLVIAGTCAADDAAREYFEREIAPACDGEQIRYVGPVTDAQKIELLGRAAALLFPIEWEEPFGIVMVEALACGTPVIAFRRGAVPEVVEPGINGFLCDSVEEMVRALGCLRSLERRRCRETFERRFSDRVIVGLYEDLYRSRVGTAGPNNS